ncbi:MAG: hypothetical protein COA66_03475 [Arcobacter sp.]|nr:MAG: hypothetical protein COA66_03475 [Arcobacter sp.]
MKKAFTIENQQIVKRLISENEYGTLALCVDNKPYSVPINYVEYKGEIYFHGAKKGKKIEMIKENAFASFSMVEAYSLLPSYFSTEDGKASPATHLYKSVIIDGEIEFVEDFDEKVRGFTALMQKYQKEGQYLPLSDEIHKKIIKATAMYKLVPTETSAKIKFGQNYNKKRYARVTEHLEKRGTKKDLETLELMRMYHEEK